MSANIEYIIVGGPQHGETLRSVPSTDTGTAPSVVARDGKRCIAAARRRGHRNRTRVLLLHPDATGDQFLTMLVA